MLWPGTPDDMIQIVDVRDLANFTLDCLDRDISGTYNMVCPRGSYTIGRLLEDCQAVTATNVDAVWIPQDFLAEQGLHGGGQLPIWHGRDESMGFATEHALKIGMHYRPGRETVRDLMVWWDTLPEERRAKPRAGLSAEQEAKALAAWKEKHS